MGPFLFLLFLCACSGGAPVIEIGKTSKKSLLDLKGAPLSVKEVPGGEVYQFSNEESVQINNDLVTGVFRSPVGDEINLIFWKHKFRECITSEIILSEDENPEVELSCKDLGESVVFVSGSGKVLRVYEYEKP